MDLHQLRYFLAVVDARSFTRAAAQCGVAQPSLSQQIARLERELGQRLFDRLPRGSAPTDAGRALEPRARAILADVNAIGSTIASDLHSGRGQLHVGAIPTMAPYLVPPLLKTFAYRFPECRLTLREDFTERLVEALLDNELDLAVMSTPIDDDALQLQVVGQERLLLVSAADFVLPVPATRLSIGDLRDQPAVVLQDMHCLGQQIDSFCSAGRVTRRIVCQTTQLNTVLELVALGLGVSIVPEMCARADVSKSRRYHVLGAGGPQREIAVAYRVDRTLPRLGRELIELLRNALADGRHAFPVRRGNCRNR